LVFAAERRRRLAVGETHGTVRDQATKPRSGDGDLDFRSMSPLRGFGRNGIG